MSQKTSRNTKKTTADDVNTSSSPTPQSNGKFRKLKINSKIELTEKQKEFVDLAMSKDTELMFCIGPAGTSKTYLSILSAIQLLNMKAVDSLLYIRSAVESTENRLGFLPGEEAMKLEPYLRPLRDKLTEFLSKTEISYMWKEELANAEHVGFARGQDWKKRVIIIDEAQNLTFKELLTVSTRSAEGSKVFIIGDPMQSDIGNKSGFTKFYNLFDNKESINHGIRCFQFNNEDIVRSRLVKYIISVCEKYKEDSKN
jgi:phosphate starvation-inducible PhoH-like protein